MNLEDKKILEQMCRENHDLISRMVEKCGSFERFAVLLRQHVEYIKGHEFLTVSEVAEFLETSERRVRTLLSEGRIEGFKDASDTWRIKSPLSIKPGTRGPDLHGYPARKLQPRKLKIVKQGES